MSPRCRGGSADRDRGDTTAEHAAATLLRVGAHPQGALFDSGIVVAAVVAVVLDLVLPGRRGRTGEPSAPAVVVVDDVAEHRPPAG